MEKTRRIKIMVRFGFLSMLLLVAAFWSIWYLIAGAVLMIVGSVCNSSLPKKEKEEFIIGIIAGIVVGGGAYIQIGSIATVIIGGIVLCIMALGAGIGIGGCSGISIGFLPYIDVPSIFLLYLCCFFTRA